MELVVIIGVVALLAVGGLAARSHRQSPEQVSGQRRETATQIAGQVVALVPTAKLGSPSSDDRIGADFTVLLCGREVGVTLEPAPPSLLARIDVTSFALAIRVASTRLTDAADLVLPTPDRDVEELLRPVIVALRDCGVQNFGALRIGDPQVMQIIVPDVATLADEWPRIDALWSELVEIVLAAQVS